MEIKDRISEVCHKKHRAGEGVLLPRICPYCFGCPIATLVAGASGLHNLSEALPIPEDAQLGVMDWLAGIEEKLLKGVA